MVPGALTLIALEHVSKAFGTLEVLDDLSLQVDEGQIVAIVGPSGVGKTTILKLIAGIVLPDAGRMSVVGAPLAYVFQEPRLLPWRTAADNVAAPLRAQGMDRTEARAAAGRWLGRVGLEGFEHFYPAKLSGGMAQRVSIARALAVGPRVLLLDEPFGNVDVDLRASVMAILQEMIGERAVTAVHVTHDLIEALQLADRIVELALNHPPRELDLSDRKTVAMDWISKTLGGLAT